VTAAEAAWLVAAGREVRLSRPDKVLFPAAGFTKRDLAEYYLAVAPAILPHLAGRAVTLARFPDGVEEGWWFQSSAPPGTPPWIPRVEVRGARGQLLRYLRLEEPAALVWAASAAAVEIHPFLALADRPAAPTALVLDLDPAPPAGLADACRVALAARARLAAAGLAGWPKTSGARGVHVVVPLDGTQRFEDTKAWARALAAALAAEDPVVTDRMTRGRAGTVLVDWRQNAAGLQTVAPYSLRGTRVPRVSTPATWTEMEAGAAGEPLVFGPREGLARLARLGDLHAPVLGGGQRLPVGASYAPPPTSER
jgi:bifunctional non-homologous end joining protein LigD